MSQSQPECQAKFTVDDSRWMLHVIRMAGQARGRVEPNPMVAATVIADGKCVGEGVHSNFGGPHAEVLALSAAGESAKGATLYVNLEPCCHHGKTPPCTDSIVKAGVARVVCSMVDPFDKVAGKGVAALRAAGVTVDVGCAENQARALNAAYLTLIEQARPLVIAKWAQTIDGKLSSARLGRWITQEPARTESHRLRSQCQAILVGAGTVTTDDPQLTCRMIDGPSPLRCILDGQLRTSPECRLAQTARQTPVIVFTTAQAVGANPGTVKRLKELGVEVMPLSDKPPVKWADLLKELGRRRTSYLLAEGGRGVLRSLLSEKVADHAAVFVSSSFAGSGLTLADDSIPPFRLAETRIRHFGCDALIEGRIVYI